MWTDKLLNGSLFTERCKNAVCFGIGLRSRDALRDVIMHASSSFEIHSDLHEQAAKCGVNQTVNFESSNHSTACHAGLSTSAIDAGACHRDGRSSITVLGNRCPGFGACVHNYAERFVYDTLYKWPCELWSYIGLEAPECDALPVSGDTDAPLTTAFDCQ
jgi:hypothetical protein